MTWPFFSAPSPTTIRARSDLANTLNRNGLSTIQTIGVPAPGLKVDDAEAIVVALKIRSVEASQAVEAATAAYDWLSARGAKHVMYKVCSTFDSTDAGNIGPVADALGAKAHGGCALVTPAFPETGRTVYLGHLFVGSTPLNESPLKDHPLNPMHDSNLVRVLQRQSKGSVGLIDLMTVEQGSEAVSRARAELSAQGYGTAIVDAVFERDLEALGDAAAESAFSVGASGLGLGLARALARGRSATSHAATLEAVGGQRCDPGGILLSGDAGTDRGGRERNSGAPALHAKADRGCWRDRPGAWLGERAHRGGSHPYRLERGARTGRGSASALWTRQVWPCDRTRAGRDHFRARGPGRAPARRSREARRRAPQSIGLAFRRSVSALKSRRACRSCARSGERGANCRWRSSPATLAGGTSSPALCP